MKKDEIFTGAIMSNLGDWLDAHEPRFTASEWVAHCMRKIGYTPDNSDLNDRAYKVRSRKRGEQGR